MEACARKRSSTAAWRGGVKASTSARSFGGNLSNTLLKICSGGNLLSRASLVHIGAVSQVAHDASQ